jgi:adenosylmethionine-8-amino-7-oxononanoate aminotransferase
MGRMTLAELRQANARALWHPMAHPRAMLETPPKVIVRGEGCWIWDIDGHKLVDGIGGLWSANLGFGRKEIRDAIVAQIDELPYYNILNGTSHPRAIELADRLVKWMEPDGVGAVFFGNGGSDAVEGALKIARQYWRVLGQKNRTKFIALKQGYHGLHFGGMSINGNTYFRRPYEPLLPGCSHVDTPWLYRNPYTQDPASLAKICAYLLEREILFQGPESVAAFIAEPVQGAGGVIVPPAAYWPLVRSVCDHYGVLLIADEVVTGFGRTGELFGTRLWNTKADIWCLAKGISSGYVPLGATAVSRKIVEAFMNSEVADGEIAHGYTSSAHPVAAAAALATLGVLESDDILANVRRQGERLMSRLMSIGETCPRVGDVRGVGLMACLELVIDKKTKTALDAESTSTIADHAYRCGAIVRTSGPNIIVSPALTIEEKQVDLLCDVLEEVLS